MSLPVNIFTWIISVAPIIILIILMIGLKWGAKQAAPVGLGLAILSSLLVFKADIPLVLMASGKGIWSAVVILIVVWSAIFLYEISSEANIFPVFKSYIQKLSPNELLQIIALGWVFSSFLQGITGFGVAVAVGAPLLVSIGVAPLWSVVITLIAHSWGNTFGTLALAWQALITQSGNLASSEIIATAIWSCSLIWLYNLFGGICLCWFYGKWKAIKKGLLATIVISIIHGGGQLLLSISGNDTLACFLPSCLSLCAVFLLGKTKIYSTPWRIEDSKIMERKIEENTENKISHNIKISQAVLPYTVLTIITLTISLIPPLKTFLNKWQVGFAFPQMQTGYGFTNPAVEMYSPLSPLTYAGTILFISAIAGYLYFRKHGFIDDKAKAVIFQRVINKTLPTSISVICFIAMSRIMGSTGQTEILAQGIVMVMGTGYIALAPTVGLLGSFMTSSNMASNILFGQFQMTTAKLLGVSAPALLGGQTAGGAIGGSICPGNIILGSTTTGLQGKEGMVLKKVMPIAISFALACGVIIYLLLIVANI